jgi:hypothetical protein
MAEMTARLGQDHTVDAVVTNAASAPVPRHRPPSYSVAVVAASETQSFVKPQVQIHGLHSRTTCSLAQVVKAGH